MLNPKLVMAILLLTSIFSGPLAMPARAAVSLRGRLEAVWGSVQEPGQKEVMRSWLARPNQERIELFFAENHAVEIPQGWIGKQVEVSGEFMSLANGKQGLEVDQISIREFGTLSVSSTYIGNTPWVTVLCKFKDIPDEPKPASFFSAMYGIEYPKLVAYWKEVSYNQVNLANSSATPAWNVLPQNQAYYLYDNNGDGKADLDFNRLNQDCLGLVDATIDFRIYKGIQIMVNSDLGGASWGGYQNFDLDGESRIWMTTWLPDWGYDDLSIVEHEMGHGYGMKHSTAPNGRLYENQWDVMSDASYNNCGNSWDAVFHCLGQHPNAFNKDLVGWIASNRIQIVNKGQMQQIVFERLAVPSDQGILLVKIPINGQADKYYTLEARKKTGYDVKLPGEGIILHKVDLTRQVMAEFIDIDNNNNTGDEAAVWIPGESWEDKENGIWVSVRAAAGNGYEVIVSNASGNSIPPFPPPALDKFIFVPILQRSNDS